MHIYDSVYFVTTSDPWTIYKAYGNPQDLRIRQTVDLRWYQEKFSEEFGSDFGPVMQMASMDSYAFYVVTGGEVLWQWIPFIEENSEGLALRDENGHMIEDFSRIKCMAVRLTGDLQEGAQYRQKLWQQKGHMIAGRPIYHSFGMFVNGDYVPKYSNQISEYTVDLGEVKLMPAQETSDGQPRVSDFFKYKVHVLRHHFFVVMPGDLHDDVRNDLQVNYDHL